MRPPDFGRLACYLTPTQICSYLPDQLSTTLFVDPTVQFDAVLYGQLANLGFRRSGKHIYRPHCKTCSECISVRIPVDKFRMSRSQKRIWHKNRDLITEIKQLEYSDEHFKLFRKYVHSRHKDGGMDNPTSESYMSFLANDNIATNAIEFRLDQTLVAVAIYDKLPNGLSAVYTFYADDLGNRSLGTYALLREIMGTKKQNLSWLFLGYWIKNCNKMSYKRNFNPLEGFVSNTWISLP